MRKIILWLFVIALAARALVAYLQIAYGIYSQTDFNQQLYGMFTPGLELYHDFYAYYGTQLADLAKGQLPYRDFAYSYPPLFLFTLYPLFVSFGVQAASIPILLTDALTAPLIYLVASRITNGRIPLIAGLAYAISPFALLYEGYLWFSSQPMTFFLLLGIYFYLDKRPMYSAVALAIAVMFKQEALFILPAFAIWYVRDFKKGAYKGLIAFCVIVLAISLPFLIATPSGYIASVSYQTLGQANVPPLVTQSTNHTGARQSNLTASHNLVCSSISNNSRSLICNYGNFTYTDIKSIPPLNVLFSAAFLNTISYWIALPLFVILPFFFLLTRRKSNIALFSSAYSMLAFTALFSLSIHPIYRYYLLPVYVMLLAASKDRYSLITAISVPILSLLLPSGPFQILPPLFCILSMLFIGSREKDSGLSPLPSAKPPSFMDKILGNQAHAESACINIETSTKRKSNGDRLQKRLISMESHYLVPIGCDLYP